MHVIFVVTAISGLMMTVSSTWNMVADSRSYATPFLLVPCLAMSYVTPEQRSQCVSFMPAAKPGYFARHSSFVLWVSQFYVDTLFYRDASFIIVPDYYVNGTVSFQSVNFPTYHLQLNTTQGDVRIVSPADPLTASFTIGNIRSESHIYPRYCQVIRASHMFSCTSICKNYEYIRKQ
jgi:Alpha-L-arabinofuranosidase B (ABFB) domain